jgi:hypothetical protein
MKLAVEALSPAIYPELTAPWIGSTQLGGASMLQEQLPHEMKGIFISFIV